MREKVFQFRVTELELQHIQAAAARADLRPSEWARQLILATAVSLNNSHTEGVEDYQVSFTGTGQVKMVKVG